MTLRQIVPALIALGWLALGTAYADLLPPDGQRGTGGGAPSAGTRCGQGAALSFLLAAVGCLIARWWQRRASAPATPPNA